MTTENQKFYQRICNKTPLDVLSSIKRLLTLRVTQATEPQKSISECVEGLNMINSLIGDKK